MSNLIQYTGSDIQVANDFLIQLKRLHVVKKQIEEREQQLKKELKEAMENYGIQCLNNKVFVATYEKERTRTSYDREKIKKLIQDCGLLESDFKKESKVKAHVKILYRQGDFYE